MDTLRSRPPLLFICQHNPWRLNNGGIIRNYWLLHALTEHFAVDLVTADDDSAPIPAAFAARCAAIYRFPRPTGLRSRLSRLRGALRIGGSYYTSGGVTAHMRRSVASLIAQRSYRAAVIELGMRDATARSPVPVIYASHNCEAALLVRRAELEPFWPRMAMRIDALRVRRLEAATIARSPFVTACSQQDIDDMAVFAPSIVGKSVVVPNGVDTKQYARVAGIVADNNVVLITGSFDWLPNRRGLLWFIDKVLPILEERMRGNAFRIRVAGRMNDAFARTLNAVPNVTAAPNVADMTQELAAATIVAVPVIASSGTRLRILEAWAAGRPVVTTPHGALGIDITTGIDLISCESPERFAQAIVDLLRDAPRRAQMRAAGLARAATYDWSLVGTTFIAAFETFGMLTASTPADARAGLNV